MCSSRPIVGNRACRVIDGPVCSLNTTTKVEILKIQEVPFVESVQPFQHIRPAKHKSPAQAWHITLGVISDIAHLITVHAAAEHSF